MEKMIVVGNENFDELIIEDGYYVDVRRQSGRL